MKIITPSLPFVASATFFLLSSFSYAAEPTSPPAVPVTVAVVKQHDVQQTLTLVGKLEAQESVIIRPEVSGKVDQIKVQSNQDVKAEQALFQLDMTKARETLREAKAYYDDELRKEREYSKLVKRNAVTQTVLEAQKASVNIAKARYNAAQADLSYLTIKAPFDGTIGFIDFSKGKMVSVGEQLVTLDNLKQMRLDVQIPEKYIAMVSKGMAVETTSRAWPDEHFLGNITHINTRLNNETLSVPARINIPNTDHKLKPGMLMSATLTFPAIHKPIIPVQALEYSGTKRFVYVVNEGKVTRREVTLGVRVDSAITIESGLEIGEFIVVKGLVNMKEGLAVKILETAESSTDAEQGAQ